MATKLITEINIEFDVCPYCGKDPDILHDKAKEDEYWICTCPDENCEGCNRITFDDIFACQRYWNGKGWYTDETDE